MLILIGMKLPSTEEAYKILEEAEKINPGSWIDHSRHVGEAAEIIASFIPELDKDTAKVLGLLHDIGRRSGHFGWRHTLDGYKFLLEKNYYEAAQICLTHSFPTKEFDVECHDCNFSAEEVEFVRNFLNQTTYNDYDKLIQLCDGLANDSGFCLMEKRLVSVSLRHGFNALTLQNWQARFDIKKYFEEKIGQSIYELLPGVKENTFK